MRISVALGRQGGPLGTKFTLSYGLGLIPFVPNLVPSREKVNNRDHLSQRDFVGSFTGGLHVQDALTSTSVSGVETATQFPNANKPPNSQLEMRGPKQHLLPARALSTAPLQSEALPTPVKAKSLAKYLSGYPEKLCNHLLKGFLHGFRLHYYGPLESSFSNNLVSASEHPDRVDQKLTKEIQEGRIVGPFAEPPLPNLRISPLGVIPKKVQGEFRMIHHLSFPFGASVNDFIPQEFCSVHYAKVDDAIRFIKRLGRGCTLAKTDVRSAFRIIPIHPLDYHLLGMQWEGTIMLTAASPWVVLVPARPLRPLVPQWSG